MTHQREVTGDDISNVSPVLLVVWLQEVLSHMESLDEGVNIVRRHPPHSHLLLWVEAAPKFDAELVQKCLHRVFALPVTAAHPEIMTPDWAKCRGRGEARRDQPACDRSGSADSSPRCHLLWFEPGPQIT